MAAFYLGDRYKSADKFTKAKSYLDRILSSREAEEKPPHANVVWARRATAQLLARGGGYQDLRDALNMIDANAVDGLLSSEDKLLKATLYAQRPEPVSRRNAIRLLEEVKVGRGLSASSHLTLAELYRQMNDWEKARQQMVELLTRNPESSTILVRYTSMLVQRGDLDAAERRLRELKKLVPDDPRAIELEARLLAKRNQTADAVAMVRKLVPANPEVKDLTTIAQVAVLLEQIGAHDEAEKYYRLYYQMDPRAQLVLAGFLGRHGTLQRGGTLEEAFRLMDQAIGKFDLNQVIAVGISTIRQRKAEVADRFDQTVDGWIEKARRENPDAARPLLSLAEFRDLQENYSEVEQLYKQLLTHKDLTGQGRALVLNNLAYVMAMQGRDPQQALAYIKEAVDILGPSTELLDTRAMANLAAGDHVSAISDLNLALSASPSELKHFHLALANMAAGNDEAARDALQKAQGMGLKESTLSGLERSRYEKLVAWLAQIGQTARS
jgi:tetratricopeptide (TPR) repeat protein